MCFTHFDPEQLAMLFFPTLQMLVSSQREVLQEKVLSSLPPTLSTEVDIDITCSLSGLSPLFFFFVFQLGNESAWE